MVTKNKDVPPLPLLLWELSVSAKENPNRKKKETTVKILHSIILAITF